MIDGFGAEYAAYSARTNRLVPRTSGREMPWPANRRMHLTKPRTQPCIGRGFAGDARSLAGRG